MDSNTSAQAAAVGPGYDFVVVGAGAAGCVVASRLSERSSRSVLLLEAGPDFPPGSEPTDILDPYPSSYYNKDYMWPGQKVHWRTRDTSPAVGFDQGRVIGGGSSVMGMVALRGTPDDYEEWERLGAAGWGWSDVLPHFRALETDMDFSGEMHGSAGSVPIRRVREEDWTPVARGAARFAEERQLSRVADMNADFRDGYCSLPMSNTRAKRASAAICYLDVTARSRPNLTVIGSARVDELLFEGNRVTGVRFTVAGETRTALAGEVILCAGAIRSAAMLLAAGIGPSDHLHERGVTVRLERRGVGRNLQNHPVLFIGAHLRRNARQSAALRTLQVTGFRLSSGVEGCPPTDLCVNVQSKSSWNALGAQIANFGPVLWKPFSRGRVSLPARGGDDGPLVEMNFLDDERDLIRLRHGFRWVADLLSSEPMRGLMGRPFPVRFTDRLRRLNQLTPTNARKALVLSKLLNVSSGLSDRLLALMTSGGAAALADIVADDGRLDDHIRTNVAGTFHVCGTCRMGPVTDPDAVVDASGRVHGIAGLRVADASVMPNVPRGNTNIPTLMVAEKLAAAIEAG